MTLKRAIIHVGTGKTGSSAIQELLASSGEQLAGQGVAFLGRMLETHVKLQQLPQASWQKNGGWPEWLKHSSATTDAFLERLNEQLNALEKEKIHTIILSNEGLMDHVAVMQPIVAALAERGLVVDVVAVVRRHYEWAFSAYLQWGLRHKTMPGRVRTFRQFLKQRPPRFAASLRAWRDCQGVSDLLLINYSVNPNIVPAFFERLGIELPEDKVENVRVNPAATLLEALILATYNDHRDGVVHPLEASGVLKRLESSGHVLQRTPNHGWPGGTEEDLELMERLCREDLNATNGLLSQDGQPTFPGANEKAPTLPTSMTDLNMAPQRRNEELLAALLSVVVDLDQHLRKQQHELDDIRKLLRKKR
ncbi:MAG: hypothetical protein ACODUE_09240 [Synechococcus sp.]